MTEKNCMLCGNPTSGSIGAAGIRWSMICQPCKDAEDDALLRNLESHARIIDLVYSAIGGNKK